MRDPVHPGGPGRLVLVAGPGIEPASAGSSDRKRPARSAAKLAPLHPVIHAGDALIVEEHTAVVDARLEAVALGPAVEGASFGARLKIGGRVVRAVAVCGRAVRSLPRRARRSHEGVWISRRSSVCASLAPAGLALNKKHTDAAAATKATPPEEALRAYIARVRAQQAAEVRTPGSIWSPEGQMVRLGTDAKAFRIHDVVMIVVSESLAASTDGQVKNSRASNANSGLTSLFGALKTSNALQNLIGATASSGLTAQGQSTTNSSLATTFGAEVVDVLPNGMLVVQATRQLTFSQQTQLITLRGLVRPEDVSNQNQVLSTAMTDLELEVTGKGIVNDSTYRQNPLVRFLEKLLVF